MKKILLCTLAGLAALVLPACETDEHVSTTTTTEETSVVHPAVTGTTTTTTRSATY